MAYTEFTCEELAGITLEDLERGSMVELPDGSFAKQVVIVASPDLHGDFNDDFSNDFNIQ